jgi:hypothetical protein
MKTKYDDSFPKVPPRDPTPCQLNPVHTCEFYSLRATVVLMLTLNTALTSGFFKAKQCFTTKL